MKIFLISILIIFFLLSAGMSALASNIENALGLGYGLPYGGEFGINYELGLTRRFAPTVGIGYLSGNLGWNAGVRLYFYPSKDNTVKIRTTALYGTNAVLKDGPRNNEAIEDISIGLGVNWGMNKVFNVDADIFYRHVDIIPDYKSNGDIIPSLGLSYSW